MPTKEQEQTFENISDFFSIAEELVALISENMDELSPQDLLERLKIIETFLDQIVQYSEMIAEDYTQLVEGSEEKEEKLKGQIKEQIVLMIISLNNCREELLLKLENDEKK